MDDCVYMTGWWYVHEWMCKNLHECMIVCGLMISTWIYYAEWSGAYKIVYMSTCDTAQLLNSTDSLSPACLDNRDSLDTRFSLSLLFLVSQKHPTVLCVNMFVLHFIYIFIFLSISTNLFSSFALYICPSLTVLCLFYLNITFFMFAMPASGCL